MWAYRRTQFPHTQSTEQFYSMDIPDNIKFVMMLVTKKQNKQKLMKL